ncbi:MAG: ParB/RepB/Spo0J family partition protein [Caldicoprobacterales bacterium]|jgi:ParB family chromosome partitioning protein|nr:ParB/RepB/Spo0J family partition protein [Clostridiales bacterium]
MAVKKGLGRGLDALFESYKGEIGLDDQDPDHVTVQEIKITDIDPNPKQARNQFDEEKLKELADSIRIHGVVQPIIVRPHNNRYIIVAGERRWRASRAANKTTIPAIVMDLGEEEIIEVSLIENLQREDLNPIEEARGIQALVSRLKLTQEEAADRLGKSRPAIANALRLLHLSGKIQDLLADNKLSAGHARALLALTDEKQRDELAAVIIEKDLSVRETEKLIQRLGKKKEKVKVQQKPNYILDIESELEESLGTRVQICPGKKKGIIEIEYYSNEDLERIIERVTAH